MDASVPQTDHPIGSIEQSLNALESTRHRPAPLAAMGAIAPDASAEPAQPGREWNSASRRPDAVVPVRCD
jgi:hypothetical protein